MSSTPPKASPKRADAARNRETILAVAREAFADPGAPVSMAEIARRAGLGMATLYRNFPGRPELLEALYRDEVDTVVAAAATVEGDTPGARFEAWLGRFFAFYNAKHHVGDELLSVPGDGRAVLEAGRTRVVAAGTAMLDAGQASGEIRGDLTVEQVLDLMIAVAKIRGEPAYVEPILAAVLAGLRRPA